jgi:predicted ArsR family transcriptional regulator
MQRAYGLQVPQSLEEICDPQRLALIVYDMQVGILSLLVSSEQSVGEIERQLRMPQPTVSKHLRVLREAGFVESTVDSILTTICNLHYRFARNAFATSSAGRSESAFAVCATSRM